MNKYQNALNRIDMLDYISAIDDCISIDSRFIEDIETLKELVDKEIPMKPVYREFMRNTPQHEFRESCPNCNNVFDYDGLGKKHCCHCGQAIDWSEEE